MNLDITQKLHKKENTENWNNNVRTFDSYMGEN